MKTINHNDREGILTDPVQLAGDLVQCKEGTMNKINEKFQQLDAMNDEIKTLAKMLDVIQDRTDLMFDEPDENGAMVFNGNIMYDLDDNGNPTENAVLMDKIEALAQEVLITADGHPDYKSIQDMKKYGYKVYAGERDSFGWLTGCIQKGNGPIFVFG